MYGMEMGVKGARLSLSLSQTCECDELCTRIRTTCARSVVQCYAIGEVRLGIVVSVVISICVIELCVLVVLVVIL